MVGGHGTSAAFGPILEAAGLEGGTAVAVASATFGLVAGCLIGGPIASSVIKKYVFYFHGAKAGRKYELAKLNPKVGFEIDGKYSLVDGELACDYTAHFQSVIGNGILSLVENQEEKVLALNSIMKQTTQNSEWTYSKEMLNAVAIFRLDVENFSCKGW